MKNEGVNLIKMGFKWVNSQEFFGAYLKNLKDNIKKELDTYWETCEKETMQPRKAEAKSQSAT